MNPVNPSLYIHIPFCLKKCDYCDFFSVPISSYKKYTKAEAHLSHFIASLKQEILLRQKQNGDKPWETVYIGGGTPSLLTPYEIISLCSEIHSIHSVYPDKYTEWTIEANPEDISAEWLSACQSAGINRLSLGIQTLNDDILAKIGRRGSRKTSLHTLELLHTCWKGQVSVDLISGLPGQKIPILFDDINTICDFAPQHVSLYALTVEDNTPLGSKLRKGQISDMPQDNEADNLWINGRDLLEKKGFRQYEVSNFAVPGAECRHNMRYWHLETWYGVGPGASGSIFSKDTAYRYTDCTDMDTWKLNPADSEIPERIDRATCMTEYILMGFRLREGISKRRFKDCFTTDILDVIGDTVGKWQQKELLFQNKSSIALTKDGLLVLNSFLLDCMEEMCARQNEK